MSDIRFNQWLHQSGTGGVSQSDGGHVGIGTTNPLLPVGAGNTNILHVGVVTSNSISAGSSITATTFYGSGANLTGIDTDLLSDTSPQLGGNLDVNTKNIVFGDSAGATDDRLTFGAGTDLSIYHQASNNTSYLLNTSTDLTFMTSGTNVNIKSDTGETLAKFVKDGAVELYHNNSKKLETTSSGITLSDQLQVNGSVFASAGLKINADNQKLRIGAGDDFEIFHDGTTNRFQSNGLKNFQFNPKDTDVGLKIIGDGAVELYHDGTKQCETSANGLAFPAGKGIDFSATGNASGASQTTSSELLDDYEEGSWTPVIAASAANPSFTFVSGFPRGRYRKIGEQVTLWYDFAWSGLPSQGGGTLQMQNFPYTTSSGIYHGGGLMSHTVGTNAGGAYTGKHTHYANPSSSFMYILSGASTNGHMQCTALNGSGHIFGFFTFAA